MRWSGVFCVVGFFLGFILLTDFMESIDNPVEGGIISSSGAVYIGKYTFSKVGGGDGSEGKCQIRAHARRAGTDGMFLLDSSIKFMQGSIENELSIDSGLLLRKSSTDFDYYGATRSYPFYFPIAGSQLPCTIDSVEISFRSDSVAIGRLVSSQCQFEIRFDLNLVNIEKFRNKISNYSFIANVSRLSSSNHSPAGIDIRNDKIEFRSNEDSRLIKRIFEDIDFIYPNSNNF